ncbi:MAG: hypothetical protein HY22_08245 [[Candidatus Thermochlorobacteriaceae] bacterium GBChlB]|jgi:hypothetical protein|nr:MAG: hypothetical protein HY22_08245 [[Candidatus Thermochlorobacteriaceae] bacterium GBChlB]
MKTRSSELGAQVALRWYAEKPFAYKIREEYQKRMTIGLIVAVALFASMLGSYYINAQLASGVVVKEKPKVVIDVTAVPPPPPTEVQQQEIASQSGASSDIAGADVSTAAAREAVASGAASAVESALAEALSGGVFGESSGLPTPTEGATGDASGLLSSSGAGGGLRGLSGVGGLGAAGLGGTGEGIGFGAGSGAGGGLGGPGGRGGLGGGGGGGLGIGRTGKLAINTNFQKMNVGAGGRTREEIMAVVKSNNAAIYGCYVEAKGGDPNLKGEIVMRVLIGPDGAVRDVQVAKASIANDNMKRCVQAKMRRMKFSAVNTGAIQQVDIPYNFSDDNG